MPEPGSLSEACFQQRPLPFARREQAEAESGGGGGGGGEGGRSFGQAALEFGNGTRLPISTRLLSSGTTPPGSTWAVNPLPFGTASLPLQFRPPCGDADASRADDSGDCSGRFPVGVSIVDTLRVPEDTPPGEYVLGFRYDCEATAQVWSSCADLTVV
jgi:hypothetical protein